MKTINGIPVYLASILNPEEGIFDVSLVEDPAVQRDFVLFNEDKMNFSVQNEEERIISGVVMLADTPIYRRSSNLGEYYIVFSRETLKFLAERLFKEGRQNNISLDHNEELVTGVVMLELFVKDSSKGIDPKYLENVTDGSLIASYKVHNDEIWKQIKEGNFKGFSISGLFTAEPALEEQPDEIDEILNLLNRLDSSISGK